MPQDFNEAVANGNPQVNGSQQANVNPQVNTPVVDSQPQVNEQPQPGFGALDNSGEIEKQQFDPTPYIGNNSFIEFIEERKGQYGFYIRLLSQVVDEGKAEIRASVIFGLEENKEGGIGWPPDSKLYNFLKKFGITHYRDLIAGPITTDLKDDKGNSYRRISGGMKTQIKIQTRQASDGKEYLTF